MAEVAGLLESQSRRWQANAKARGDLEWVCNLASGELIRSPEVFLFFSKLSSMLMILKK